MQNFENNLLKQAEATGVTLLPDRLPDAVDLVILPAGEMAVVPGAFLPRALVRPVASLASSIKLIMDRASTTTQGLYEIHERFNAHPHGGINE